MPMHARIGGVWKTITPSIRIGGVWKTPIGGWVNIAGTWRKFYPSTLTLTINLWGQAFATAAGNKSLTASGVVGDLLVVYCVGSDLANSGTLADNQGGTYTLVTAAVKNASADVMAVFVRNQFMANTNAHVLTWTVTTNTGGGMAAYRISGMPVAGAAAIRQSAVKNNINAGINCTCTLPALRVLGNVTMSGVFTTSNPVGMTPDAAYTAMGSGGWTTPTAGFAGEVIVISGNVGVSVPWGTAAPSASCAAAVEVGL